MKIPSKLKIGGITYEVRLVSGLADSGSTQFEKSIILINKEQTLDRQETALYHEIIEIFNEMGDFNLQHSVIQTLEAFTFQVIKDNFK